MSWLDGMRRPGVPAALGAALLFGAGTPFAKALLANIEPWLLAVPTAEPSCGPSKAIAAFLLLRRHAVSTDPAESTVLRLGRRS
jgi:hypothetical protein